MTLGKEAQSQVVSLEAKKPASACSQTLRDCLYEHLQMYFDELDGEMPGGLYELAISEMEAPLFDYVLRYAHGNVSRAAEMLGIHRSTLRRKLVRHGLI